MRNLIVLLLILDTTDNNEVHNREDRRDVVISYQYNRLTFISLFVYIFQRFRLYSR